MSADKAWVAVVVAFLSSLLTSDLEPWLHALIVATIAGLAVYAKQNRPKKKPGGDHRADS